MTVALATAGVIALAGIAVLQQLDADRAGAANGPIATKSAKLVLANDSSLTMSQPNEPARAAVTCPGRLEPYGGAQSASPDPDREGEGVYPHSYERLGAQSGFHSTPVLYDPTPWAHQTYQVTLQVLCGKKPGKIADPHDIATNVPSGASRTLVVTCPKKSVLIGGGFQRAAFEAGGGVYPTESHAISKTKWQASGTAFGDIENDMVSIGYCMASPKRKPLLTEMSSSVVIPPSSVRHTTTPSCPDNRRLVWNGFKTDPLASMFFADGIINGDDSFTASAYNKSNAPATLTAYGYCLKKKVIGGSLKKFSRKIGRLDSNESTGKLDQDGDPNG